MEGRSSPKMEKAKSQPRPSKNRDMDGFLDMLTRAQCCRVDDQRGLLTKEQLEVPLFLQVSSNQGQDAAAEPSTPSSTSADSKEDKKLLTSGEATSKSPDSAVSETKDLKETTV